jgi:transposase
VIVVEPESLPTRERELEALVCRMQSELTTTSNKLAAVTSERDSLRRAYRQLMEQFELLRRRIFIAKAERVDVTQLELEFEKTKQKLDALAQQLGGGDGQTEAPPANEAPPASAEPDAAGSRPSGKPPAKTKSVPKGRRNLAERDDLTQRRVEIRDAELEKAGAAFIGWELSEQASPN